MEQSYIIDLIKYGETGSLVRVPAPFYHDDVDLAVDSGNPKTLSFILLNDDKFNIDLIKATNSNNLEVFKIALDRFIHTIESEEKLEIDDVLRAIAQQKNLEMFEAFTNYFHYELIPIVFYEKNFIEGIKYMISLDLQFPDVDSLNALKAGHLLALNLIIVAYPENALNKIREEANTMFSFLDNHLNYRTMSYLVSLGIKPTNQQTLSSEARTIIRTISS